MKIKFIVPKLRWCSPVKHFALSRRRSRVQIPAGAFNFFL
jgi:hypothetical protein